MSVRNQDENEDLLDLPPADHVISVDDILQYLVESVTYLSASAEQLQHAHSPMCRFPFAYGGPS